MMMTREQKECMLLDEAKKLIDDFCMNEYGEYADFSDLKAIGIAYTDLYDDETDDEIEVQVNANLIDYTIDFFVDDRFVGRRIYRSLDSMIKNELMFLNFDSLVSDLGH